MVCVDARQALIIDVALHQFEALKPIVVQQRGEIRELRFANRDLHTGLSRADSIGSYRTQQLGIQAVLRGAAEADSRKWKSKAKSRFWTILGETALLIGITTLAISHP